jgi:hypothetical protein
MIDQFDIVKGRLGEHASHWITSRARLSQPENLRRGARSNALVLSKLQANFLHTPPRYNGLQGDMSKHPLGGNH